MIICIRLPVNLCEGNLRMKRHLSDYEDGLKPEFRFLSDRAVIIQAWKKAHEYVRRHNWYSDNFELDLSCINLEDLCSEIQQCFERAGSWQCQPLPMRVVPAPKECGDWRIHEGVFTPPVGFGLRPLAHLCMRDQVVSMMFLMCLANVIERRQGVPRPYSDLRDPTDVVSYGNRLLSDAIGEKEDCGKEYWQVSDKMKGSASFLWGNSETYSRYYMDYQNFIARPKDVLRKLYQSGLGREFDFYTVVLDLTKFYDRIDRLELRKKVRKESLRFGVVDEAFQDAFASATSWSWDKRDDAFLQHYQRLINADGLARVDWRDGEFGLPQGLAAAGFLANIYMLDFDDYMKNLVRGNSEITLDRTRVKIFDYCRYVDDMRIVVGVAKGSVLTCDDRENFKRQIQEVLVCTSPGQFFAKEKIRWEPFVGSERVDFEALEVAESKAYASGALGERSACELIALNHDLWVKAGFKRNVNEDEEAGIIARIRRPRNTLGVRSSTLERFAANNWRRAYKVLSSMLPDEDSSESDPVKEPLSLRKLNALADDFCEEALVRWLRDPSKVRILRIAFDLRPRDQLLAEVLNVIIKLMGVGGGARACGAYVAAELYRAAAVETGYAYSNQDSAFYNMWRGYRRTLHEYVGRIDRCGVPWFLANQLMLFEISYCGHDRLTSGEYRARCDAIYGDCEMLLTGDTKERDKDFPIDTLLLAYCVSGSESILHQWQGRIIKALSSNSSDAHKCISFLPLQVVALFAGLHVQLKKENSLLCPGIKYSLREVVLRKGNPFDNEVAIVRLGIALTDFFKGKRIFAGNFYSLQRLVVSCNDWIALSDPCDRHVFLRIEENVTVTQEGLFDYLFKPEPWERGCLARTAQIGRILRAVVMSSDEFSLMRQKSLTVRQNGKDATIRRFFGVKSSWLKRRYGLYFDRTRLGGVHVGFSPWFTGLLSDILAWPGANVSKRRMGLSVSRVAKVFNDRLHDLASFGRIKDGTILIPVDVDLDKFKKGRRSEQKVINVAVVQNLHPDFTTLNDAGIRESKEAHRKSRRHLSDLFEMLEKTFKTHKTLMATKKSINLIVFPELAIYERDVYKLKRFADVMNCMIFCGLVYCQDPRDENKIVNAGLWIVPQRKVNKDRREFIELLQGKGNLARIETDPSLSGYRPVQWIIRGIGRSRRGMSKVWSLSASICYDATDIALAAALRDHIDCYIVAAFNKDVGLFDAMAESWRYHMYGHAIVANTGIFGGSTIQAPYDLPYARIIAHVHGPNQAQILLARLDLGKFERKTPQKTKEEGHLKKTVKNAKTSPAGYVGRLR